MSQIVRAAIYPAIGVARVGNSPNDYFIGPEVPYALPNTADDYRDSAGRLKRQAAQFRIYGFDADNNVVQEITVQDATIEWMVHVANRKAAWYETNYALDLPTQPPPGVENFTTPTPVPRRNANFSGDLRQQLVIDPGPRLIHGTDVEKHVPFDTGRFVDLPVYLGELRVSQEGRLIFLGGHGVSGTPFEGNNVYTFGNNNGWYDDTSDGPVEAQVTLNDGTVIPVEAAWVVTAPPNYAPDVNAFVSMYDVMLDTFITNKWLPVPSQISFMEHIYPILEQFCMTQWVNKGFSQQFGYGAPNYFLSPQYLARLSDPSDTWKEFRLQILHAFRLPYDKANPKSWRETPESWPWFYGDGVQPFTFPANGFLTLTSTQYAILQQWQAGNFVNDYTGAPPVRVPFDQIPLAQQPETLTKAAMTFCLGGPFHPGCEMTWPMRQPTMYSGPFRIRRRDPRDPESDYGDVLTPDAALSHNGPIYSNQAGDLTRWMAIPWQTDTASCRSGYDNSYDPYLPTFWPARVPNNVLSEDDYRIVMNKRLPLKTRLAAYNRRPSWYRPLGPDILTMIQINNMITEFGNLGVIVAQPGYKNDPNFPPVIYVEMGAVLPKEEALKAMAAKATVIDSRSIRLPRHWRLLG